MWIRRKKMTRICSVLFLTLACTASTLIQWLPSATANWNFESVYFLMRDQQLRIAWMNTSRFPRRVFFPLLLAINCLAVLLSCVKALQELCQSCPVYVLYVCLLWSCLQCRFCCVSSVWLKHKMCAFLGMTTIVICRVVVHHHCLDWTWIGATEQLDFATRSPVRLATHCKQS